MVNPNFGASDLQSVDGRFVRSVCTWWEAQRWRMNAASGSWTRKISHRDGEDEDTEGQLIRGTVTTMSRTPRAK